MAKIAPRVPPPGRRRRKPKYKDMILWWPLNDGPATSVGSNPLARSGIFNPAFTFNSSNGALSNSSVKFHYDPRVGGYCYDNNRSSPALLRSDNNGVAEVNDINVNKRFTMGVCLYATAAPPPSGSILFAHNFGVSNNCYIYTYFGSDLPTFGFTVGGADKHAQSATPIVLKRWNQIVGTYDGANIKIYVNGELKGTTAETGTPDQLSGAASHWVVGDFDLGGAPFTGYLWNAFVFGQPFVAEQVRALYDDPFDMLDTPPVDPPPPPPPPPPGGGGTSAGTLLVGRPANHITASNLIVSNRSGGSSQV